VVLSSDEIAVCESQFGTTMQTGIAHLPNISIYIFRRFRRAWFTIMTAVDALRIIIMRAELKNEAYDHTYHEMAISFASLGRDLLAEARTVLNRHEANWHLYESIYNEDLDGVNKALELGAKPNGWFCDHERYSTQLPPLHLAAGLPTRSISKRIVARLVRAGADPNHRSKWSRTTPLMRATMAGNLLTVKVLLKAGADHALTDLNGETALFNLRGTVPQLKAMAKVLVAAGADINKQNVRGATPLHFYAGANAKRQFMECLLELGANPSIQDCVCRTAFMWAVMRGNRDAMRVLLDFGN
jgi:hypothetical protein